MRHGNVRELRYQLEPVAVEQCLPAQVVQYCPMYWKRLVRMVSFSVLVFVFFFCFFHARLLFACLLFLSTQCLHGR